MPTTIYFRGREDGITVDGDPQQVADQLRHEGLVRLITVNRSIVFVNASNILYLEEAP